MVLGPVEQRGNAYHCARFRLHIAIRKRDLQCVVVSTSDCIDANASAVCAIVATKRVVHRRSSTTVRSSARCCARTGRRCVHACSPRVSFVDTLHDLSLRMHNLSNRICESTQCAQSSIHGSSESRFGGHVQLYEPSLYTSDSFHFKNRVQKVRVRKCEHFLHFRINCNQRSGKWRRRWFARREWRLHACIHGMSQTEHPSTCVCACFALHSCTWQPPDACSAMHEPCFGHGYSVDEEAKEEEGAAVREGELSAVASSVRDAVADDEFGWRLHYDDKRNLAFYLHGFTGEVRWIDPEKIGFAMEGSRPIANAGNSPTATAQARRCGLENWSPCFPHVVMMPSGLIEVHSAIHSPALCGYNRFPIVWNVMPGVVARTGVQDALLQRTLKQRPGRRVLPPTWETSVHDCSPFLPPYPVAILGEQANHSHVGGCEDEKHIPSRCERANCDRPQVQAGNGMRSVVGRSSSQWNEVYPSSATPAIPSAMPLHQRCPGSQCSHGRHALRVSLTLRLTGYSIVRVESFPVGQCRRQRAQSERIHASAKPEAGERARTERIAQARKTW